MEKEVGKKFSLSEPYAFYLRETKIERVWDSFWGAFSIERPKVIQYSQYAGMTYFSHRFDLKPFSIKREKPGEQWIIDNLKSFVRTEFSEKNNSSFPKKWPPKIEGELTFSSYEFDNFITQSEWINRKIEIEQPKEQSPVEIAKAVYNFLCNPLICSNKNRNNNNQNEFVQRILQTIKDKNRLVFVLPGFPFKDQNRFRVPYDAGTPDFGEVSFMLRLRNLTETIYQVYEYGSDIILLTDGDLYKDVFGISDQDVSKYLNKLLEYRYNMNIQGAISFISLKEMIDRSSEDGVAWQLKDYINEQLQKIINNSDDENLQSIFNTLVSGMKWNLENRCSLKDYDDETCWKILKYNKTELPLQYQEIWEITHQRAIKAAFEYASVNLMLHYTKLISLFFPNAIRATVHPKPNQFALSDGGAYAWNGIAFSRKFPRSIDDIKICPLLSIAENDILYRVKFEATNLPCFYTAMTKNVNIEIAKNILNPTGWTYENIKGREFKLSDVDEFIQLGNGDINFSWQRVLQSSTYYTSLLQFRISHYKKFGFGVHGIWIDNKLIGQFGIQVLDKDLDKIEIVIFLGKGYVRQGIGKKILSYMLSRCAEKGLYDIYAVIRPENLEAIKLFEQLGFVRIGSKKHYNCEGILYSINLKKK